MRSLFSSVNVVTSEINDNFFREIWYEIVPLFQCIKVWQYVCIKRTFPLHWSNCGIFERRNSSIKTLLKVFLLHVLSSCNISLLPIISFRFQAFKSAAMYKTNWKSDSMMRYWMLTVNIQTYRNKPPCCIPLKCMRDFSFPARVAFMWGYYNRNAIYFQFFFSYLYM